MLTALRRTLGRARSRLLAWRHNARLAPEGRILVLRAEPLPDHNDPFLAWIRRVAPEAARRFELRTLPLDPRSLAPERYALLVPWLQDPLRERFPATFEGARAVEAVLLARGLPIVNPVASLSVSQKTVAWERLRAVGIRVPRAVPIADRAALRAAGAPPHPLSYPFFVREDRRHGGPMIEVAGAADHARLPLDGMEAPIAVERIDVRSPDGLHRKRRYLALGGSGVPRHEVASRRWVVHAEDRVLTPGTIAAERAYVEGEDPHAPLLERARLALGLDVVAFDYSEIPGRPGEIVLWEPNPLPTLWAPFNERRRDLDYQRPVIERVFRALLGYLLERAGLAALAPGPASSQPPPPAPSRPRAPPS